MRIVFHCLLLVALITSMEIASFATEVSQNSTQEQIRQLQQLVIELQKRVRQLEKDKTDAKPETSVTAAPAPTLVEKPAPVECQEAEATAIGAGAPKPLNIGGHPVKVGVNASIQVDAIHDFNALGLSPDSGVQKEFITAYIPVGGVAAQRKNRTGVDPNASYFAAWVETPTPWGPLKGYVDVNLFGSSTDVELQIYKAYGNWGWLKAGLDYSLWLNQSAMPDTLDFEGPNAIPEARFTQASLKIPLRPSAQQNDLFLTLGVEDAPADLTLPTGITDANTSDQFPSLIGKLSYEPDWAQIELAGLYRRLKAEGTDYDQTLNCWGVILDGSIDTWGNDNLTFGVLYGEGIGAYIDDTQGLGLDAAPDSVTDPDLNAIPAFAAWAGYQHWWAKSLRSTATYGFVGLDDQFDETPNPQGTFHQTHYASMNLVWSPWPPFDIGIEYLYGRRVVTDNSNVKGSTSGDDHRIQTTVRWNFDWES